MRTCDDILAPQLLCPARTSHVHRCRVCILLHERSLMAVLYRAERRRLRSLEQQRYEAVLRQVAHAFGAEVRLLRHLLACTCHE